MVKIRLVLFEIEITWGKDDEEETAELASAVGFQLDPPTDDDWDDPAQGPIVGFRR